MKKIKFEKIQLKCYFLSPGRYGMADYCDHDDNPNENCEEENCPKLKELNND